MNINFESESDRSIYSEPHECLDNSDEMICREFITNSKQTRART